MAVKVRSLKIRSATGQPRAIPLQVTIADTFFTRLVGLLSRKSLSDDEGLLLSPCASIHTIGMRFPIDVLFLDKQNKVIAVSDSVESNKIRKAPRHTHKVLEIAQGNRIRTGINLDDYLIFD